jgi:hypothetical protein
MRGFSSELAVIFYYFNGKSTRQARTGPSHPFDVASGSSKAPCAFHIYIRHKSISVHLGDINFKVKGLQIGANYAKRLLAFPSQIPPFISNFAI